MKWFGKEPWNRTFCDPENQVETPAGEKCHRCTSHIEDGEQGMIIFHVSNFEDHTCDMEVQALHLDCFLKMVLSPDLFRKHQKSSGIDTGKN